MRGRGLLAVVTAFVPLAVGCWWFRQEPPVVYGISWASGRLVRGSGDGVGDSGRAREVVVVRPVANSPSLDRQRDGGIAMAGLIPGWDPAAYSLEVRMTAWKQGADGKRKPVSASGSVDDSGVGWLTERTGASLAGSVDPVEKE